MVVHKVVRGAKIFVEYNVRTLSSKQNEFLEWHLGTYICIERGCNWLRLFDTNSPEHGFASNNIAKFGAKSLWRKVMKYQMRMAFGV